MAQRDEIKQIETRQKKDEERERKDGDGRPPRLYVVRY